MSSRILYTSVFTILILALILCAIDARRRLNALGRSVSLLDIAFIPPILGNCIIIMSHSKMLSMAGSYIYFIGMDFMVYALMGFVQEYCKLGGKAKSPPKWIHFLLITDIVQYIFNPFTGHAFDLKRIAFEGEVFYSLVPHIGQVYHRVVVYGIFLATIIGLIVTTLHASRIYRERYSVILFALIGLVLWQTYYIVKNLPIDRSMIGFGIVGVLIYYFAMYYRPLKLLDRILSGVVSNGSEAVFIFTPKGRCIWTNKEGCYLVGVQENNCENAPELLEYLFNTELRKGNWSERHVTGGGDSVKYYMLENRDVVDEEKHFSGYYLKVRDITEEELKLKHEIFEATHDKLTGLFTREYLYKLIKAEIRDHSTTKYLVVFINIKNFKIVNDIFGTEFGDHTLKHIADYLRDNLSARCTYGRIEGDNFGVLAPADEFDKDMLEDRLSKLTIKTDTAEYPVLVQLGVYEVTREESDVITMFARARLALATLGEDFSKHIAFYDDDIRKEILWNQEIAAQLQEAIANRDIRPYLQPIVDGNGDIVGAEALVRWVHKEHGFLAPYKFIPSLEKNGKIAEVDKYMWRCACEILQKWKNKGWNQFISVNISPKDFYYLDVPKYITSLAKEYDLDPGRLRVEITETVMMNDTEKIIGILDEFRKGGFIVEMDDFGSGYSSLNMLKDMPVDVLKIDMKFLGKSDDEQRADTIVNSIINLSRELGITSLTEGVETEGQYSGLSDMGCKLFQGYYFSKPVPVEEFEALVESRNEARHTRPA